MGKNIYDTLKESGKYEEYRLSKDDLFNISQNELFNKIKKTIMVDGINQIHAGIGTRKALVPIGNDGSITTSQTDFSFEYGLKPYADEIEFSSTIWQLLPETATAEIKRVLSTKIAYAFDKGIFTGTNGFQNIFEVVENEIDLETENTVTLSDIWKLITATKKKSGNLSIVLSIDTLEEAIGNLSAESELEKSILKSIIEDNKINNVDIVISENVPAKKVVCGNLAEMELHLSDRVDLYKKTVAGSVKYRWEIISYLAGTVNIPDSFYILA